MKYLGIHKLIWAILVLIYTLWEAFLIFICCVLHVIWTLKFPKNVWKESHTATETEARLSGIAYSDNNMWETLKRRYKFLIH